jgi:hypothetical protein
MGFNETVSAPKDVLVSLEVSRAQVARLRSEPIQ